MIGHFVPQRKDRGISRRSHSRKNAVSLPPVRRLSNKTGRRVYCGSMGSIAALGFRVHTGWAAAVAATGECDVLDRRRLSCEPKSTRFVYHRAAEIPLKEAESLIRRARAEVISAARREIANLLAAVSCNGIKISSACVAGGNSKLPDSLAEILAAHSRIHTAEGAFYRDALAEACEQEGLRVERVPERDLWRSAAAALALSEEQLREHLALMRKRIGPPWGEDQKLATLASCCALPGRRPSARGRKS